MEEQTMMGILPSTNEWPQNFIMAADRSIIITPSTSNSSTTSTPDTAPAPRKPLNCPRCDSTNTKFCYYNNYSLSQPRHFCKACKRYWTRGGTLRNVPVGGGCRKNKRVKKSNINSTATSSNPSILTLPPIPVTSHVNSSSTADVNPSFFYNLSNSNMSYSNLQQRMQQYAGCGFYDLQPQMSSLALGFTNQDQYRQQFGAGMNESTAVSSTMQEVQDYSYPMFGSSSATAASLLVSSLKQPRKLDEYQNMVQYQDQQVSGNLGEVLNQVKLEGEGNNANVTEWQLSYDQTPLDAMAAAAVASTAAPTDSPFMYWNAGLGNSWPEATSYGSSIAPLI